jgi:hypothetical protein
MHRAAHRLWADRHNISLRSLREGSVSDLASDVNLLTFGAIPLYRSKSELYRHPLLYFYRGRIRRLASGPQSQ